MMCSLLGKGTRTNMEKIVKLIIIDTKHIQTLWVVAGLAMNRRKSISQCESIKLTEEREKYRN